MKRILKKLFKGKFSVMFGLVIGAIIMGGISYGVNQIQSSGVSYTKKDGTTVSVKQALDDVINKSLSEINILKSEKENLEKFYEHGVERNLADVVKVGDYVAYDAGSWTETTAKPTSQGQFGGYTKDQNKANSVACYAGTVTLKGWRVFSIDTTTKTVTLIHAGQPECYYHARYEESSVTILNNRAIDQYLNSDYADSAHMMNRAEADQNILRKTGSDYWLAEYVGENWGALRDVTYQNVIDGWWDTKFGIRPVVVLKSNILTIGKGFDKVGQVAWTLVKP